MSGETSFTPCAGTGQPVTEVLHPRIGRSVAVCPECGRLVTVKTKGDHSVTLPNPLVSRHKANPSVHRSIAQRAIGGYHR